MAEIFDFPGPGGSLRDYQKRSRYCRIVLFLPGPQILQEDTYIINTETNHILEQDKTRVVVVVTLFAKEVPKHKATIEIQSRFPC